MKGSPIIIIILVLLVAAAGGLLLVSGKNATMDSSQDQGRQAQPIQLHGCRSLGYTSGYMAATVAVDPQARVIRWTGKPDTPIWSSTRSWSIAGPAAYPRFNGPPAWARKCLEEQGGIPVYVYFRWSSGWTAQAARFCVQDSNGDGLYTTHTWIRIWNFGYKRADACAYAWVPGG